MGRICTNPHQSIKLLQVGFSPAAADMWWSEYAVINNGAPVMTRLDEPVLYSYQNQKSDIPAWTLTTLLLALPGSVKYDDSIYNLHIFKEDETYIIDYSGEHNSLIYRDGIDLIDITVQIILHLIKLGIPLNPAYLYNNI